MVCGYKLGTTKHKSAGSSGNSSSGTVHGEERGFYLIDLDNLTQEKIPIHDKNYFGQIDLI